MGETIAPPLLREFNIPAPLQADQFGADPQHVPV
jgi:hypothetical protein